MGNPFLDEMAEACVSDEMGEKLHNAKLNKEKKMTVFEEDLVESIENLAQILAKGIEEICLEMELLKKEVKEIKDNYIGNN